MQIKLCTSLFRNGAYLEPNSVHEIEDSEAQTYIDNGCAELLSEPVLGMIKAEEAEQKSIASFAQIKKDKRK